MLPPPAPLPEVEPSLDAAYLKKHDRPPTKTVRREDADVAYEFEENQAGPSALSNGAPPPFDDAPPPFFSTIPEASTSSRLPTFLESESEVLVPDDDHPSAPTNLPPHPNRLQVAGEGSLFGFLQVDQYDGHSDEMQRSSTPPPTLEMAQDDADVTGLAGLLTQPAQTLNALDLSLENDGRGDQGDLQPPPPPPMDDPLDPPPSIDSEYRSSASDPPPSIDSDFVAPGGGHMSPPRLGSPSPSRHAEPPPALDNPPTEISRTPVPTTSPSHAPPPYLIPANLEQHQHDSVTHTRPPPYVDFMPSTEP
ncbi:hypothetical protein BD410DRAFT_780911 [Rickenella mellea]|uniref:Uncharacterized protein n=1 Tax=Rickenella mellea TaxID=50990 RepID=A0A4Y7QMY7_9AGAM|nr:hypothetical protein BD410DRAFT_780911 [Rickenella mellea]